MKVAGILRRFVVVSIFLTISGGTVVTGGDFQAAVDWIYYQDASGRELSFDFSSGSIVNSRTLTIPASAYTLPASEAGAVVTWERADGLSDIWLDNSMYYLTVPQALPSVVDIPTADITIDGSVADWSGVATYADDITGDVDSSYPTGCDIDYVKLAYSSDSSILYILFKLTENANTNVWYRLFLDTDLDENIAEPDNYQIDVANFGSWDVITQTWDSSFNWYDIDEGGIVSVSGQYIEAAVDCSAMGLPRNMNVFGRTMQVSAPYETYDRFYSNFHETEGAAYLYSDIIAAPTATEWQCSARIADFSNPGFGDSVPYLNYAGAILSGGTDEALSPMMEALWVTGDFNGNELDDSLLIMAHVEYYDDANGVDYEWDWGPETGEGVVINGLDPSTTAVDLSIEVTDGGQKASFYYRINSDDSDDWQQATSHAVPDSFGKLYGVPVNGLCVGISTGFMRSAPVYRFWSDLNTRHFYTTSLEEKNKLIDTYATNVWLYEQIAYYAFAEDGEPNVAPVYRFWSPVTSGHFYTVSESERDKLINEYAGVWIYEGTAFYAWPEGSQPDGSQVVYRFWSPVASGHFYTVSESDRDKLINEYSASWTYEGVAWYAYAEQPDD